MKLLMFKKIPTMIIGFCTAFALLSLTVNAAEGNPQNVSAQETAETTAALPEESTAAETKIPDNPFTDGMLSDDELYQYIADYLDVDTTLDLDGSGVLIDESIINPSGNAEDETDESGGETAASYTSGEKVMYTIATRDGSTFYIIIDKGSSGENVYFLNKVDITDLASLIGDKDEDDMTEQEKQIIAAANGITVKPADKTPSSSNGDNSDIIPGDSQSNDTNSDTNNNGSNSQSSGGGNTMYLIIGGVMVVAIIIAWYFKIGPGKKKKTTFAEEDYEDEEEEAVQENYINEDEIKDEDDSAQ